MRIWGDTVRHIDDRDIPISYFETFHRYLTPRARVLQFADDFYCPPDEQTGWQALQEKIRRGDDLNPHLSQRHASLSNDDGLLAEWHVHHFHLGTKPLKRNPYYVSRTGALVYALVDDDAFYAINVYKHGNWELTGIIESLHRNWPEAILSYRVRGIMGEQLGRRQRRTLRMRRVNVYISTMDGTIYRPIGGGVSCSGQKTQSVVSADGWRKEIQLLQSAMERRICDLMPIFEEQGYTGENELEAELRMTESGYQVVFPQCSISANLLLDC